MVESGQAVGARSCKKGTFAAQVTGSPCSSARSAVNQPSRGWKEKSGPGGAAWCVVPQALVLAAMAISKTANTVLML